MMLARHYRIEQQRDQHYRSSHVNKTNLTTKDITWYIFLFMMGTFDAMPDKNDEP